MDRKPIFVIGTPRSGTTLTAEILGRHSRIFMPGETHYFDDIYSRSEKLGDITDGGVLAEVAERLHSLYDRYYEPNDQKRIERLFPTPSDLVWALKGCVDYGEVFARFMELQMDDSSKHRWGNNAPRDLFSFREIRRLFPEAKLIVCVRDIRAFLLSYRGKWQTVVGDRFIRRMEKLYHPVITSYLWKSSMRQIPLLEEIVPSSDMVIMRYEDLVLDPETMVRKICNMIEEEFEPSMLRVDTHNSSNVPQGGGIFATSINRWQTELSAEEVSIGQNIAKKELEWLEYPRAEVSANIARMLRLWLTAPIALWRALEANKDIRGPLIPYLAKRVGSLLSMGR